MVLACRLAFVGLLLSVSCAEAEPLSYHSSAKAEEKLVKTQRALTTAQGELRIALRQEQILQEHLAICPPEGIFSIHRVRRCARAQANLPGRLTHTLEVLRVQNLQDRQMSHTKICLNGRTHPK